MAKLFVILCMHKEKKKYIKIIQSNFNGSNTAGAMKISSRQG